MKLMKKKQKGFTLIELMIVLSILALLAGLIIPIIAKAEEKKNNPDEFIASSMVDSVEIISININKSGAYHITLIDNNGDTIFRKIDVVDEKVESVVIMTASADHKPTKTGKVDLIDTYLNPK